MDPRTLRVLEYEAVRKRLRAQAATSLGRALAEAIEPATELLQVRRLLAETAQARALLAGAGRVPLGGVVDVRAQVMNAERGGVLAERDLMDISNTAYASRRMRSFLLKAEVEASLLVARAGDLGVFENIEREVERCIDSRGEVVDAASDALRDIRRHIRRFQESIEQRLHAVLHSTQYSRMIQEPLVTVRNGRYCIPVRSEFKGEFHGIVHDSSSSGATVFMEPFGVVEVNNELREARVTEEREVRRVLTKLSALVGEHGGALLATLRALAALDLIFARAALADAMNATNPELNAEGKVNLIDARHPLLDGNVVPVSVRIGEDFTALVLTGPNTGGKTVTIKTVGLLALMAQSGMHIPAASGSRLAVFGKVFADIGDEQSIQQSLSTFSSHMTQVVTVLNGADGNSLALLDEIGAGTDPAEGSALAKAVLLELVSRGCRVIATTHYGELKAFAYTQEGIENGSVEFDPVTLEPTYRVSIGTPGTSNAFAIASRLGVSLRLLRQAAEMMGERQVELHEVMQRAERNQRDLTEERRLAARTRAELEQTKQEYEQLLAGLKAKRREQLAEARDEARRIVARAKQRTEELLNLLRQSVQEAREAKQAIAREMELVSRYAPPDLPEVQIAEPAEVVNLAREELAGISDEAAEATVEAAAPEPAPEPEPAPAPVGQLMRGDAVMVRSVHQRGTVLEPPDNHGQVQVQVGLLRLSVPVTDLSLTRAVFTTVTRVPESVRLASGPVPNELHLRGLRVDAALYELERYLDQAMVAHHQRVRIVHGKGTGAVKNAVHERLREHPLVKSFRLGEHGEGDGGVTIVELGGGL